MNEHRPPSLEAEIATRIIVAWMPICGGGENDILRVVDGACRAAEIAAREFELRGWKAHAISLIDVGKDM